MISKLIRFLISESPWPEIMVISNSFYLVLNFLVNKLKLNSSQYMLSSRKTEIYSQR